MPSGTDLDAHFSALSSWAKRKGHGLSLKERARTIDRPGDHYFGLTECCWEALFGSGTMAAVGPLNYLATFEEFFRKFSSDSTLLSRKWQQVASGPRSSFLDALSEAAWALTISNRGVPFALDQALGGANRKDADLVLGTAEPKLWLDVKSLHFDDNDPVMRATRLPGTPKPKAEQVREVLLDRAERYYTKKFKKAAQDGSLGKHPVGLLLCLLKCEPLANRARTNFLGGPPEQLRLPYQLVTRAPNLGLVLVHSLTRRANSDILEPAPVVAWVEPQAAAFANLLIV